MGRTKVPLTLIRNQKSRHTTFVKRKAGLKKKAMELSVLCGIRVSVIIYASAAAEGRPPPPAETWPEDRNAVLAAISQYHSQAADVRGRRSSDLTTFFEDRMRKKKEKIAEVQRQSREAMYAAWDPRLETLTREELGQVHGSLARKLEAVRARLEAVKEGTTTVNMYQQPLIDDTATAEPMQHPDGGYFQFSGNHVTAYDGHVPMQCVPPLNFLLPPAVSAPQPGSMMRALTVGDEDEHALGKNDATSSPSFNNFFQHADQSYAANGAFNYTFSYGGGGGGGGGDTKTDTVSVMGAPYYGEPAASLQGLLPFPFPSIGPTVPSSQLLRAPQVINEQFRGNDFDYLWMKPTRN